MINLESLKELGDGVLENAKTGDGQYEYASPVLITLKNGGAEHETVIFSDEDEKGIMKVVNEKALDPDVQAMVVFTEARVVEFEEGTSVPKLDSPEGADILYVACFTPDTTLVKKVVFKLPENQAPIFVDMGWEENPNDLGALPNPFQALRKRLLTLRP